MRSSHTYRYISGLLEQVLPEWNCLPGLFVPGSAGVGRFLDFLCACMPVNASGSNLSSHCLPLRGINVKLEVHA